MEGLPALERIEEVRKELIRRNPRFDGKLISEIENNTVVGLSFRTMHIADIFPVKGLAQLRSLQMNGALDKTKTTGNRVISALSNLSPLEGMNLTALEVMYSKVSDLTPLRGMPLETLKMWAWRGDDVTPLKGMPLKLLNVGSSYRDLDLTPLARSKSLESLCLNQTKVSDLSPLENVPLTKLLCERTRVSDLTPLRNMRLEILYIEDSPVTDISPLSGMPLKELQCDFEPSRDAEILRQIKTLETINMKPAAEFWKQIDAAMSSANPPLDEASLEESSTVVRPAIASKPVASRAVTEKPPTDE